MVPLQPIEMPTPKKELAAQRALVSLAAESLTSSSSPSLSSGKNKVAAPIRWLDNCIPSQSDTVSPESSQSRRTSATLESNNISASSKKAMEDPAPLRDRDAQRWADTNGRETPTATKEMADDQTQLSQSTHRQEFEEWTKHVLSDVEHKCRACELEMTQQFERSAANLRQRLQEDIHNCETRMSELVRKCEQRIQQAIAEATEMRLSENGPMDAMHERLKQEFAKRMQSMETTTHDQIRLIREEQQEEKSVLTSLLEERTHQLQEQISSLSDRSREATFVPRQKPDDETVAPPAPSRKVDDRPEPQPANGSSCKGPNERQPSSNASKKPAVDSDATAKVHWERNRPPSTDQNIGCHPSIDSIQYMKRRLPHLLKSLEQQLREFFLEMSDDTETALDSEILQLHRTESKNLTEESDPLPTTKPKRDWMDEQARLTIIASQLLSAQKRIIKQKRCS